MDRGVKIAIFVASIVSLALGLIWDQVLNQARTVAQQHTVDEFGPDLISAIVGPPEVPRLQPPEGFDVQPVPVEDAPATEHDNTSNPAPESPEPGGWTEYTVAHGDSWWRIANTVFKDRGLDSADIQAANPGKQLHPGVTIKIPPKPGAAAPTPAPSVAGYAAGNTQGPIDYVVQDGDSWWKIAYVHFKDRKRSTEDLKAANPGVSTLRPGTSIKIP